MYSNNLLGDWKILSCSTTKNFKDVIIEFTQDSYIMKINPSGHKEIRRHVIKCKYCSDHVILSKEDGYSWEIQYRFESEKLIMVSMEDSVWELARLQIHPRANF